jgi:signal transduction histidine kinase
VSQKILREHGGDVRVESTPDVGSRFSLEFPAIIPSPNAAGDPQTEQLTLPGSG